MYAVEPLMNLFVRGTCLTLIPSYNVHETVNYNWSSVSNSGELVSMHAASTQIDSVFLAIFTLPYSDDGEGLSSMVFVRSRAWGQGSGWGLCV